MLTGLAERTRTLLTAFHEANPLLPGMPTEQLRGSLATELEPKLFRLLLAELERSQQTVVDKEHTRLTSHRVQLDAAGTALEEAILDLYRRAVLSPPRLAEAATQLEKSEPDLRDLLSHLARIGSLTHVTGNMFISSEALDALEQRLIAHLEEHESIDTQTFKRMVGASRKHVIPLAEFFDRKKITIRVGDKRVLRGRSKSRGG